MKFAFPSVLALVSSAVLCAACGGLPELAINKGFEPSDAGAEADAPEPPTIGPSLVIDDMHIATYMEAQHAFALFGMLLNPQLEMAVQNGTMLMGLEMRGLDDPSGQSDPELSIGMWNLTDPDGDPSNNFDPDAPATFTAGGGGLGMGMTGGGPLVTFDNATITGGMLHAEGVGSLMMPGGFGLPLFNDPSIDGQLVPTPDNEHVRLLEQGRMTTALPASMLQNMPNIFAGLGMGMMMCQGQNMLDALATGCGFVPYQPDVDIDGDGLETFYDTMGDPDAGTPTDGHIDKCVDGDGTEILGPDCVSDPRIADGYKMIFAIHGVRAIILAP